MNQNQLSAANNLAAMKARTATDYTASSPEAMAYADPGLQNMMQSSEGNQDQNAFDRIYNTRFQQASSQEGLSQLAEQDHQTAIKNAQANVDWWNEHPNGNENWADKFMGTAMPLVVGGIFTGGALGLMGGGVGEVAGAAAMDSVGTDIASQLASGNLALGSGVEAGVGAGAAGSGYATAGTIGGNVGYAAATDAIGGLTAAGQESAGGAGATASQPNTFKDYWKMAKTANSGLSLARNIGSLINPPTPAHPSVGNGPPGAALNSTIGGLSQSPVVPQSSAQPTYHDWQSYVAPGM